MTTYVPASDAIKSDYLKFKQHLMMYTDKIVNFNEYNEDARYMCKNHQMDLEIKSIIIDTVGCNLGSNGGYLMPQLGEHHTPLDRHLDQDYRFSMQENKPVYDTWPYFTFSAVKYLARKMSLYDMIEYLKTHVSKIQWSNECIEFLCNKINYIEDFEYFFKHMTIPLTIECIYLISKNIDSPKFILKLIDDMPNVGDKLITMIKVKQCTYFDEIFKHVAVDQSHIKLVCAYQRIDLLKQFLNHKLTVDAECFELMFLTKPNRQLKETIADAVETFINFGYELTYTDVVRLARRGYYVHDINRFNFKINNELIEACLLNDHCIYTELMFTLESLQIACLADTSEDMIKLILETGVIPNRQCVINALKTNKRYNIMSKLIEHVPIDAELAYHLVNRGYNIDSSIKY